MTAKFLVPVMEPSVIVNLLSFHRNTPFEALMVPPFMLKVPFSSTLTAVVSFLPVVGSSEAVTVPSFIVKVLPFKTLTEAIPASVVETVPPSIVKVAPEPEL